MADTIQVGVTTYRGMARAGYDDGYTVQSARLSELPKVNTFENVTRFFVILNAADVTSEFSASAAALAAAKADVAAYASYGLKTVIVLSPVVGGLATCNDNPVFWNNSGLVARYAAAVIHFTRQFVGQDDLLGIEVINEPHPQIDATHELEWVRLAVFYNVIISGVRTFDTDRYLIVSSGGGAISHRFKAMTPLNDKRILYNFHFYEPRKVTHQAIDVNPGGVTYPSSTNYGSLSVDGFTYTDEVSLLNDITGLRKYIKPAVAFSKKYGVPLIITEMACTRRSPGTTSVRYTKDQIKVVEEAGINWINWGNFGIYDSWWGSFYLPTNGYVSPYYPYTAGAVDSYNPACVVLGACKRNEVYYGNRPAIPTKYTASTDFDDGYAYFSTQINVGGTIDTASTLNPKSGTKHARLTANGTASTTANDIVLKEDGSQFEQSGNLIKLEFDFVLDRLPAAGTYTTIARTYANGGGIPDDARVFVKINDAGKLRIETQGNVYVPETLNTIGTKFNGDGSNKVFKYTQEVADTADIRVYVNNVLKEATIDYLIKTLPSGLVSVIFNTAPSVGTGNVYLTTYKHIYVEVFSHATKGKVIVELDNEPVLILLPDVDTENIVTAGGSGSLVVAPHPVGIWYNWKPHVNFVTSTNNQVLDVDNITMSQSEVLP